MYFCYGKRTNNSVKVRRQVFENAPTAGYVNNSSTFLSNVSSETWAV